MTTKEALLATSIYPILPASVEKNAVKRELDLTAEITREIVNSPAYNATLADCLLELAVAPNIAQGGQSYSFTAEERKALRKGAFACYNRAGLSEEAKSCAEQPVEYGYKGSSL